MRAALAVFTVLSCACVVRPVLHQAGKDTDATEPFCDEDCPEGQVCFEGMCVGTGLVRVSLAWEGDTDLDLHVVTPSNIEVFYANPESAGLTLDVDDCVGGFCAVPGGTHVENIFFSTEAERGTYRVFVEHFEAYAEAPYRVEVVTIDGTILLQWQDVMPNTSPLQSEIRTFDW